jgi:RHS repeat-associated protein
VAQLAEDGSVSATFVYGTKTNSPDLIIKNNVTYRIIHDHVGSPIYVINSENGEIVQKIVYDMWGNVLSDSNPGFQPFGFAGGIYDGETGLIKFGARDYDPSIGRWLNKDPLRFDAGSNFYVYADNDPINKIDPDGMQCIPMVPSARPLPPVPRYSPNYGPMGEAVKDVMKQIKTKTELDQAIENIRNAQPTYGPKVPVLTNPGEPVDEKYYGYPRGPILIPSPSVVPPSTPRIPIPGPVPNT